MEQDLILSLNFEEEWIVIYHLDWLNGQPCLIPLTDKINVRYSPDDLWLRYIQIVNWNVATHQLQILVQYDEHKCWSGNKFTITLAPNDPNKYVCHKCAVSEDEECPFIVKSNRHRSRLMCRTDDDSKYAEFIDTFRNDRDIVRLRNEGNYLFFRNIESAITGASYVQIVDSHENNATYVVTTNACTKQTETFKLNVDRNHRTILLLRDQITESPLLLITDIETKYVRDLVHDKTVGRLDNGPNNIQDNRQTGSRILFACTTVNHNSRIVAFDSNGLSLYSSDCKCIDSVSYEAVGIEPIVWLDMTTFLDLYYVDDQDLLIEKTTDYPLRFWTFINDKIQLLRVQDDFPIDCNIEQGWTRINQVHVQQVRDCLNLFLCIKPLVDLVIDWSI